MMLFIRKIKNRNRRMVGFNGKGRMFALIFIVNAATTDTLTPISFIIMSVRPVIKNMQ